MRNLALEAVRVGNYWSENKQEVVDYIGQCFQELLVDAKFLRKNAAKLQADNGLASRYTLAEILQKRHEADGFDIFLPADEAIAANEMADKQEASLADMAAASIDEIQEGIDGLVAAASGEADPIGADEVIELLESSAKAGELGAAVYCGDRLDEMHAGGWPDELLDRAFGALKRFLRPSAAAVLPRLTGPWTEAQFVGFVPNQRKRMGRLVERLVKLRHERDLREGGAAAEQADAVAAGEKVLRRLCRCLLPLLAKDEEALACQRRGPLVAAVVRICRENSLEASTAVGYDVLRELEQSGHLYFKGRVVELRLDARMKKSGAADQNGVTIRHLQPDLKLLHSLSKERLDRKRKRMQSRSAQASKRRRAGGASGAAAS